MCLALQSRKFTLRVMRVLWFDYGADAQTRAEAKAQMSRDAVLSFKLIHAESANWIDELSAAGTVPSGFRVVGQDRSGPIYVRDRSVLRDDQLDQIF